jgi:hypothetical protein
MRAIVLVALLVFVSGGLAAAEPQPQSKHNPVTLTVQIRRLEGAQAVALDAGEIGKWGKARLYAPTSERFAAFMRELDAARVVVNDSSFSLVVPDESTTVPIACGSAQPTPRGQTSLDIRSWASLVSRGKTVRVTLQIEMLTHENGQTDIGQVVDTGYDIERGKTLVYRCLNGSSGGSEWLVCIQQGMTPPRTINNFSIAESDDSQQDNPRLPPH